MPECDHSRAHLIGKHRECARSGEADEDEAAEDPSALPRLVVESRKCVPISEAPRDARSRGRRPRKGMGGGHSETARPLLEGCASGFVCSSQVVIMVAPVTTMVIMMITVVPVTMVITVIMMTGAQPWSP